LVEGGGVGLVGEGAARCGLVDDGTGGGLSGASFLPVLALGFLPPDAGGGP
jgi:hypothetical protein